MRALFLLCVPLAAASIRAQDPAPPVFRAESDLVVLHVNVFDGRSDAVPNLPKESFSVTEDNRPQAVTFFSNEDVPVAVGLVLDNSTSMLTRRQMVVAGAQAFAESSHPEDELFTVVFNEHVQFGLPREAPFTRSRPLLLASIHRYPPGGMTALHDAVIAGLEHLEEASHQKRVLVVLSDGDDNASQHPDDAMMARAARSDALIYTISTADLATGTGNPRRLKKLAEVTGGAYYAPERERDVVEAFGEIAGNIRRGYSIGYSPTNAARDGKYRRVKVQVRAAGLKHLKVRARDGYLAPRHTDD